MVLVRRILQILFTACLLTSSITIFAQPTIVREFVASNNNGSTYGTNISICRNSPFTLKFKPRVNLKYYIYKSTDGGTTWTSTSTDPSITYADVTVYSYPAFSVDTKLRVFYTTDYQTDGVPLSSYTYSDEIITLTVNPLPVVNSVTIGQSTICQNSSTIASNSTPNGVWSSDDLTVATINSTTGVLTGTGAGFAIISYTVTDNNNCVTTKTSSVTVNPTPIIANINDAVCSGVQYSKDPSQINGNSVPTGTTYSWTYINASSGDISGMEGNSSPNNFNALLSNVSNLPSTAYYKLTATKGSCSSIIVDIALTVTPKPTILSRTIQACSGATFTDLPANGNGNIVPAGITYSWSQPSVPVGITNQAASGTPTPSSISGLLNNSSNAPLTVTYIVSTYNSGCQGSTFTETVVVNPTPNISAKTTTICSDGTFNITFSNIADIVPANTTYTWSAPSVSSINGLQAGTNLSGVFGTLSNTTAGTITVTYSVNTTAAYTGGTCNGSTFNAIVIVKPKPKIANIAASPSTQTGSGSPFNFSLGTTGGDIVPSGITYSWAPPSVQTGINGGAASGTPSPTSLTGTLTNFTGGYLDATYTIIPTANSCDGNSFTFIVRVYPKPIIGLKQDVFCSGGSFSVTPYDGPPLGDVVPTGTTYSWSAPVISGLTGTSSGTAQSSFNSGTLYNNTNYPIIVEFAVTPRANPQDGDAFIVRITVNPLPKASIDITETSGLIVNDKTICSNETATITAIPVVGATTDYEYTWSVPSGINTPTLTTSSFSSNLAGQYSLGLRNTSTGCVSASLTSTTMTVTTAPTVGTISSSYNTVCVNSSIQLQGIGSSGGATPYTSYWWYTSTTSGPAIGSATVDVRGVSAGNGSISYSVLDQFGCFSSRSLPYNITVYALPLSPVVTPVNVVYDGLAHQVMGTPAAAPFGNDEIEWYSDINGGSAIIPIPNITNAGTITRYAQAINNTTGCVNLSRVSASVTITPKALTITANDVQKTYDKIAFAGPNSVSYSGFVNNELPAALSGTLTFGGSAINAINAGTYVIEPSGYTSNNYAISYVAGKLTINKLGLTITGANVLSKTYDASDNATMNAGSLVGLIAGDNVDLNYSVKFPSKNVGTNLPITSTSTISGSAASNYTLDPTINVTASITPKQIDAIGLATSDKIYDGTNNASVTGGGFNAAIDPGTGTTTDRTPYKNDIIQLAPSGNFVNKNVGNNITITSTSTITGADANNYTLVQPNLTSRNITPKALSMDGLSVASPKIYDGTTVAVVTGTPALLATETPGTGTVNDGKPYNNDIVSIAGTPIGTYNSKDVLTANAVSFSGLSLTGTNANNYTLTIQSPYASNILRKALNMFGLSVPSSKVYDGNTSAKVGGIPNLYNAVSTSAATVTDGYPIIGDDVSIVGTPIGTYNSKDVISATYVAYSGLDLAGNQASNYSLNTQSNSAATITPLDINVKANAQTKVYGEQDPYFTFINDPLIGDDSFMGSLERATGESAGTYTINQGTIVLSPNYTIKFTSNTLTILKAEVVIQPNPVERTYGDQPLLPNATTSNFTATGLKNNETISSISIKLPEGLNSGNGFKDSAGTYEGVVFASNPIPENIDLNNYKISFKAGNIVVKKYTITISAESKEKRKTQVDPPFTYVVSRPLVEGDSLVGQLSRESGEEVGFYKILQGSVFVNNNYDIKYLPAFLEILTIERVIVVPNAFTPNNDGLNDVIKIIRNSTITSINYFKIFDRSGKQIFETKNINEGWDGKLNGAVAESDAYYWMAEYNTWDNKIFQVNGSFVLIK